MGKGNNVKQANVEDAYGKMLTEPKNIVGRVGAVSCGFGQTIGKRLGDILLQPGGLESNGFEKVDDSTTTYEV